jgi:hypothetical protein
LDWCLSHQPGNEPSNSCPQATADSKREYGAQEPVPLAAPVRAIVVSVKAKVGDVTTPEAEGGNFL